MIRQDTACRICGGAEGTVLSAPTGRYWRCHSCRALQKLIDEAAFAALVPRYDSAPRLLAASPAELRMLLQVDARKALLAEVIARHFAGRAPSSFLDVGCGLGGYLVAARELGMEAMGFEPDADQRAVAERSGCAIVPDRFSLAGAGGRRFDFILLSHVIEHVYHPRELVAQLAGALSDDGIMLVVTNNADAPVARWTGRYWPMLAPVDHVSMLSRGSVPHLVPEGYRAEVATREYGSEFFATVGSAVLSMLRGRDGAASCEVPGEGPGLLAEPGWKSLLLRGVLAAASLPFHLFARATDNAAALTFVMSRR